MSISLELANASITQIQGRDDVHESLVAMKDCCSASETINLLCQFPATSYLFLHMKLLDIEIEGMTV